jgi:hypothetical protein
MVRDMARQRSLCVALGAAIFLLGALLPGLALQPFHCALSSAMLDSMNQDEQSVLQTTTLADEQAMAPPQSQRPAQTLPERQWDENDLALLSGCWHLTTDLTLHNQNGGEAAPVANWVICFDQAGHGTQNLTFQDGTGCKGPVQAAFTAQHQLALQEPAPCTGKTPLLLGQWSCTRSSDNAASCTRTYIGDPSTHRAVFQR